MKTVELDCQSAYYMFKFRMIPLGGTASQSPAFPTVEARFCAVPLCHQGSFLPSSTSCPFCMDWMASCVRLLAMSKALKTAA